MKFLNHLLLLCSFTIFCIYQLISIDRPLDWDEVGYSNAAKLGIISNATEKNSLNIVDFIRVGKNKVDKEKGAAIANKGYDEETDPFKLRHFHPVLPVYYWSLFSSNDISKNNHHLRWSNIILAFLFVLLLLFCFAKQLKNNLFAFSLFFLFISMLITSTVFLESFTQLNFHNFSLLAVCFYIFALMSYIKNPSKKNANVLSASIAGLILTLETAPFVVIGSAVVIFVLRFHKSFSFRSLLRILFISILILLVCWPGILFTGGPIKSWAMYAYRIIAAGNEEYSGISGMTIWKNILVENAAFVLIVFGTLASSLRLFRDKEKRIILLPLFTGIIYALMMTPFLINHSYILPSFGILLTGLFYWIKYSGELEKFNSSQIKIAVIIVLVVHAFYFITPATSIHWNDVKSDVVKKQNDFNEDIHEILLLKNNKPMFIDGAHIFRYYLGMNENEIINMELKSYKDPGFYQRVNFQYIDRETEIQNKTYGVIAIRKNFASPQQVQKLEQMGYREKELHGYLVFY